MNLNTRCLSVLKCLFFVGIFMASIFLFWGMNFQVPVLLQLRLKKILIFLLVSISSSFAVVSFQAIVGSHFLSPGIMGIEASYRMIATLLIFFGSSFLPMDFPPLVEFLLVVSMMGAGCLAWSTVFWKKNSQDLHTLLLAGLVVGILFNSLSSFFQVLMDPNEYEQLQMRLFPTFQQVDNGVFLAAVVLAVPALISIWKKRKILEVFALGREKAVSLGVNTEREIKIFLLQIVLLSGVSAVLVGPMTFLGFTSANLAYLLIPAYQMEALLAGTGIIGFSMLVSGQFLVERVFRYQTNAGLLIEWTGGLLFFALLWREREQK